MLKFNTFALFLYVLVASIANSKAGRASELETWSADSARSVIRPEFSREEHGGREGGLALVIGSDQREHLDGAWKKLFPVEGGKHFRFQAFRKSENIQNEAQSVFACLWWADQDGNLIRLADDPRALAQYPADRSTDANGWVELSDSYLVPEKATHALVELRLRWAPGGSVKWSDISLSETQPPEPRRVRLASVHFRPSGGNSVRDNCEMFVPLVEDAARQQADLIVLPEKALTNGLPGELEKQAQSVPGEGIDFFVAMARQHDMYIVVPILEVDEQVLYNTTALVGPEGYLGKYRKVCLPNEEYETGIAPGHDYPVFDTRFGKIGMMVCWDIQFPEVSRQLTLNGAEIIACPIAGGNLTLAKARAIENQIYLVTSTYAKFEEGKMKSGVWNPKGVLLAEAQEWGTVVVTEVDLNERANWWWLGDFQRRMRRERPLDLKQ